MTYHLSTDITFSTTDPDNPLPSELVEAFTGLADLGLGASLLADLFTKTGESPEALRGLVIGLDASLEVVYTVLKTLLVRVLTGTDVTPTDGANEIGSMLTSIMYLIERSPEFAAAVALEGARLS
jgi:hypothetical protein